MEHNINNLLLYTMEATDGLIGDVKDFYFDDKTWHVRYLIVKTGGWLSGREVLISPVALLNEKWRNGLFPVDLTKKQVSSSPDIDTDKPVARQREIELYGHYQWESYWGSGFYGGGSMGPSMPFPVIDRKVLIEADKNDKREDDDNHLRSTAIITGYHIHATDGEIGHVNDFIMDDTNWQIKFIVVDTHNWFGGKKVMVPVGLIKKIEWSDNRVYLDTTMAAVKKCKLFDEDGLNRLQPAKS
jgi:sporulation protein YlmC with PRC-barrel domain